MWIKGISEYIAYISLVTKKDSDSDLGQKRTATTFHRAKENEHHA